MRLCYQSQESTVDIDLFMSVNTKGAIKMPFILDTIRVYDFAFCLIRVNTVLSMLRCHGSFKQLEMAVDAC